MEEERGGLGRDSRYILPRLKTELFDYELPDALIAQHPNRERDGGRLLVCGPSSIEHRRIADLGELIPKGALLVVNDSRVFKARLVGKKQDSGGRAEIFLLRRLGERWQALGRASKQLRVGSVVEMPSLSAEVVERDGDGGLVVELRSELPIDEALERDGHVPLPPYMKRQDTAEDVHRYQTVYAERTGSVAAPTAGLHLSEALLAELRARGVEIGRVTLHVGLGTFRPVTADDLDNHPMHAEPCEVTSELVTRIAEARRAARPVVAIGTTVVRALESAADPERPGCVRPMLGETRLLIQPGFAFRVVDALLTNFHMPKSTLLALVSAFAGRERTLDAYRIAVSEEYRFLSYGDAMWIPERAA
jgi:S-adenosylmethionine:tRNA ribosyltransferase-isomerase